MKILIINIYFIESIVKQKINQIKKINKTTTISKKHIYKSERLGGKVH